MNVSHASDPSIEAGDIAIVFDRKGRAYPILVTRTSFSPDGYHETVCGAESPSYNSSTRYSSATKDYVEIRKKIRAEKTSRELALEELGRKLEESPGLYSTIEKADSGNVYYLHDAPKLADSQIVWKMTAEAWGVSTDGGKTWNGGMMVNGDVIARILDATGVNADWINTGQLSVKKDGKEVLFIDVDTGTVRIVADSFSLSSGKTIQDIADEAAQDAVDAQTQTDIFNKLTSNGTLKGLFMKDGKLYISASYILSGILKLGGASNGNGTLEIYNSSGTRIGLFNNSGINLGSGKFVADTSGNVTAKNITAYGSFICYENN